MTPITEANNFDAGVNMYDLLDPVLGGLSGQSNDPIISLANRTRFLYNYQSSFVGIQFVTATSTITASFLRKLIYINISANITLTLDAIASFIPGQTLHFKCKNIAGKCVTILPAAGEFIKDGNLTRNIYLYDGEQISFVVRSSTEWEIIDAKGNFDIAGNDGMVRRQPRNSFIADGTNTYARADYARLWEVVSGNAIDDSLWLSDSLNYRCYFSTGNGTTTFRVPDMRSVQWRGLDLGRGISFARFGTTPGSFEPDDFKSHDHAEQVFTAANNGGRKPVGFSLTADDFGPSGYKTGATGGTETVGKNAGLIPIIYF